MLPMNKRARGFTLIELMVAITVLAVLLGLAVPSFREIINSNRVTAQTNDFVSTLNYARSEALKRSNPVTVCASTNGGTCAGVTNWSTGWIVFADINANGALDGAEVVLQQSPAVPVGLTLNSTTRAFVRYSSSGMSSGAETFALLKTGCTGNRAREIAISTTGRIASAVKACP
ncbi:MAG TPA: Tfp pilus assembly protein FimT/FimU [Steroidobacteraceae bacterium]|nr:Tfp pilus assembly protein FimT/FimU [Steroidobacteraceae bacterium]